MGLVAKLFVQILLDVHVHVQFWSNVQQHHATACSRITSATSLLADSASRLCKQTLEADSASRFCKQNASNRLCNSASRLCKQLCKQAKYAWRVLAVMVSVTLNRFNNRLKFVNYFVRCNRHRNFFASINLLRMIS